jgi:hypothetical protein
VLVVLGDAPRDLYAELHGARAEVAAVEAAWKSRGIEVSLWIESGPAGPVHALVSTAFDAVHLSGNSATDWLPKASATDARQHPLTGLVIGAADVLTPQDLLLHEQPPEVVTLASDRLGQWAPQLRRGGVRLVLACENLLHDGPASAFSRASMGRWRLAALRPAPCRRRATPRRAMTPMACWLPSTCIATAMPICYGPSRSPHRRHPRPRVGGQRQNRPLQAHASAWRPPTLISCCFGAA